MSCYRLNTFDPYINVLVSVTWCVCSKTAESFVVLCLLSIFQRVLAVVTAELDPPTRVSLPRKGP